MAARTPEQYFVWQHLEDIEDRGCASVHDIACDVFTGTDGDQERVTSVLYQLKSWRLVEETVAGFRLREGAVLLRRVVRGRGHLFRLTARGDQPLLLVPA